MSLPDTFQSFGLKYKNLAFVNILSNGCGIRVYYYNKQFECYITCLQGVVPMTSKTCMCLAKTINDIIKDSALETDQKVDLSLFHPFDWKQSKKNKLYKLIGEYDSNDHTSVLLKYLILLI